MLKHHSYFYRYLGSTWQMRLMTTMFFLQTGHKLKYPARLVQDIFYSI
jgi:hypothetical protein